ncbi:hypothetical protein QWZ02_17165 [Kinneretia asaccharophila]|uniref:hypothetical protein n=1 Tax=Roseateles asaccharophilus TaxID=582607 RepID=UPI00105EDCBF|nr:hypothetical protein [Roseateles asaccharophilus]MDN3546190.1 hypothetical protein [Roseateles asaccharophilus]
MPPNRDNLSSKEVRAYAALQSVCWVLAIASIGVFSLEIPIRLKWAAIAATVAFLLGAVVFNWARRFGIRVVWSRRFREKM